MEKIFITNDIFTKSVMRRVYAVWFLKQVLSPFWTRVYLLGILFWQVTKSVSVLNVFENAPGLADISRNASFFSHAFLETEPLVQAYTLLGAALLMTIAFGRRLFIGRGSAIFAR